MDIKNWFKKKPSIKSEDLDELIACTPDAQRVSGYRFIVPEHLEWQMKIAIGKPFAFCLWWETYRGYQIQPCYIDVYNDPNELSFIKPESLRPWTTCR